MLNISSLHKRWPDDWTGAPVFEDFTLKLPGRGRIVLLGGSGSGKSTLLAAIAGLAPIDRGSITFFDDTKWRRPGRVVLLPQSPPLLPWLSVAGNLREVYHLLAKRVDEVRLHSVTKDFGLDPYLALRPHELSGGWRHMVAFAMANLLSPELLLLDEPLASVDGLRKMEVWRRIDRAGPATHDRLEIVVTHDILEAISIADEIILLSGPPLRLEGRISDIRQRNEAEILQVIRSKVS